MGTVFELGDNQYMRIQAEMWKESMKMSRDNFYQLKILMQI